jgi:hypothetical protein
MELTGIEPVTSCLPDKRSSQLSYSPADSQNPINLFFYVAPFEVADISPISRIYT